MEKLIYVLAGPQDEVVGRVERLAADVVPAAREVGGERIALLLPDEFEAIRARNATRLMGAHDQVAAIFECWLPTLDSRSAIEAALALHAGALWGYLVTESTVVSCPHGWADGERVPGVSQCTINDKPAAVSLDDFYREWSVHSEISFGLHPHRESYVRNAVARSLTEAAPRYRGVVVERFPSLDHFVEDSLYFGDPAVVKEMFEHSPTFFEFEGAMSGGFSEFRWS